jgi:ribosomal protein L11
VAPIFGNELKPDLDVLINLQQFYQIAKAELKENRKDLTVPVKITVGSAYDSDFSYTQHLGRMWFLLSPLKLID